MKDLFLAHLQLAAFWFLILMAVYAVIRALLLALWGGRR